MNKAQRSRAALILVALLFVAPILAAWILHASGYRATATVNHGDLVKPPRPLGELAVRALGAEAGVPAGFPQGKWTFVYIQRGPCEATCREALYKMRQVRLAQGKNLQRVQRLLLWLGPPDPGLAAELTRHYPGLLQAQPLDDDLLAHFVLEPGEDPALAHRIYLIDAHGNLMMSYPPGADPKGMIEDLERLLKYG